jgi:hypothetical protein
VFPVLFEEQAAAAAARARRQTQVLLRSKDLLGFVTPATRVPPQGPESSGEA